MQDASSSATGPTADTQQPPDHATTSPRPRIGLHFFASHIAHIIALGGGSGLSPKAPGTAGTLWAWLMFAVVQRAWPQWPWGPVLLIGTLVGWWACTVTARHARVADPGFIVWDEVIAFWLVLWVIGTSTFWTQAIAFGLFRYFDAAKPGPVRWADQAFHGEGWRGGFGIMIDDIVAAGCTLLTMALALRLWQAFH